MPIDSSRDGDHDAVAEFLRFLDRDLAKHPDRLRRMPPSLYRRLVAVTEGVTVSLDDPIEGEVAL